MGAPCGRNVNVKQCRQLFFHCVLSLFYVSNLYLLQQRARLQGGTSSANPPNNRAQSWAGEDREKRTSSHFHCDLPRAHSHRCTYAQVRSCTESCCRRPDEHRSRRSQGWGTLQLQDEQTSLQNYQTAQRNWTCGSGHTVLDPLSYAPSTRRI